MLLDDIHFTTGVDEGQLEVELGENSCKELSIWITGTSNYAALTPIVYCRLHKRRPVLQFTYMIKLWVQYEVEYDIMNKLIEIHEAITSWYETANMGEYDH